MTPIDVDLISCKRDVILRELRLIRDLQKQPALEQQDRPMRPTQRLLASLIRKYASGFPINEYPPAPATPAVAAPLYLFAESQHQE